MERSNDLNACMAMMIGLLAGAVAALLLTPQSGKENREMLRDALEKAKEKMNDKKEEIKQKTARMKSGIESEGDAIGRVTEPL